MSLLQAKDIRAHVKTEDGDDTHGLTHHRHADHEIKGLMRACGHPSSDPCPYNFEPPACKDAEPQSPRNLTSGAPGKLNPKAATLSVHEAKRLPLVNIHFHLGAEHTSEEYNDGSESEAYDAGVGDSREPRPGFMCTTDDFKKRDMKSYTFEYCEGVEVGKTYEVHYVHSSAGYSKRQLKREGIDGVDDGLGGAANGRNLLNPMIVVQGVVFQIVNGDDDDYSLVDGLTKADYTSSVKYPGSTTGTSFNNDICSPYAITWHVDKKCHRVSPKTFDNLCKHMKERYDEKQDLHAHGCRKLVKPEYVVKGKFVEKLAGV